MSTKPTTGRVMNIHTLADRKFHTLPFERDWFKLFGTPERNFTAMLSGGSTCGKSTFALQFADMLSQRFGKAFYNSHEEGLNQTLRDRAAFVGIKSRKLFVGDRIGFDDMVSRIKSANYRFIFIDSIQFAAFTYDQFKELVRMFPRKSFIIVSQGTSEKQSGNNDIWFAVDCKLWFDNGLVTSSSRFNPEKVTMRLFNTANQKTTKQGVLFQMGDIVNGIKNFQP